MLRGMLVCLFLAFLLAMLGCSTPSYNTEGTPINETHEDEPQPNPVNNSVVKLSQSIIDSAIAECENSTAWSVNLAIIRSNYMVGATLEAAIVLHNGDDARRAVTIKYKPIKEAVYSENDKVTYFPSPIEATGWITIDTPELIMDKMQTEVIAVRLTVPKGTEIIPGHWLFGIEADGYPLLEYNQELVHVITDEGETELYVKLQQPLYNNNVSSVVIKSSIDENVYVNKYDSGNRVLYLDGLKECQEREMTLTYEYTPMVSISYVQKWLITMLRG